jgi:hypothetical protein
MKRLRRSVQQASFYFHSSKLSSTFLLIFVFFLTGDTLQVKFRVSESTYRVSHRVWYIFKPCIMQTLNVSLSVGI